VDVPIAGSFRYDIKLQSILRKRNPLSRSKARDIEVAVSFDGGWSLKGQKRACTKLTVRI
jgi:hypothetical protein